MTISLVTPPDPSSQPFLQGRVQEPVCAGGCLAGQGGLNVSVAADREDFASVGTANGARISPDYCANEFVPTGDDRLAFRAGNWNHPPGCLCLVFCGDPRTKTGVVAHDCKGTPIRVYGWTFMYPSLHRQPGDAGYCSCERPRFPTAGCGAASVYPSRSPRDRHSALITAVSSEVVADSVGLNATNESYCEHGARDWSFFDFGPGSAASWRFGQRGGASVAFACRPQ